MCRLNFHTCTINIEQSYPLKRWACELAAKKSTCLLKGNKYCCLCTVLTLTYLWFRSSSFSAFHSTAVSTLEGFCMQTGSVRPILRQERDNETVRASAVWIPPFHASIWMFQFCHMCRRKDFPSSSLFLFLLLILGDLRPSQPLLLSSLPCRLGVFSSPCAPPPAFYPQRLLKCPCRAPSPPSSPHSSAVLCQMWGN